MGRDGDGDYPMSERASVLLSFMVSLFFESAWI